MNAVIASGVLSHLSQRFITKISLLVLLPRVAFISWSFAWLEPFRESVTNELFILLLDRLALLRIKAVLLRLVGLDPCVLVVLAQVVTGVAQTLIGSEGVIDVDDWL